MGSTYLTLHDAGLLLRSEGRHAVGSEQLPWRSLAAWVVAAGFAYGFAMGGLGGFGLQSLYSATKVPVMLVLASMLTLPNFFVVNTLLGLRDDLPAACRGLLAMQATMAIALLGFAPIVLFGYASGLGYESAKVLNGVMFLVATICGQVTLARHYQALIARDPKHKVGLIAWMTLYTLIAIQLAWVLRPFIGQPELPVAFFREDAFEGTSYQNLFEILLDLLR